MRSLWMAGLVATMGANSVAAQTLTLPVKLGSVRFLVLGDAGTGDREQYDVANQMLRYRARFPFTFAIMLGDNIYGRERPQDFDKKFMRPYKALLDANVEFNAALGNHDDPNQRYFKPFNLGGNRYRTFKKGNARFFVIDSNYLDPAQMKWLENELSASGSDWKIAYFHHPLYTTARRGPEVELRAILEPLFVKYGVDVVFAGHEHIYERMNPQKGIYHFTVGGAAKLREGDTRPDPSIAARYDVDRSFLIAEISGDSLYFQAIGRTGAMIDRGILVRREVRAASAVVSGSSTTAPLAKSAPER
ncbi:MAG: metallophosphoesterase [Polyangiaceae bacterium]